MPKSNRLRGDFMNLKDFLQEIINSEVEDWTVNSCWGAGAGPSYFNQFLVWNTRDDAFHNLEINSHSMVGSYKKNLSISIAWGLEHNDNFVEKWANSFPDSRASSSFVDFFYNGVLVLREIIVSVDGGRCYIPLPKREFDNKTNEITRLYISKGKSKFMEMLNSFSSTCNYNRYLSQTSIEVSDESWS